MATVDQPGALNPTNKLSAATVATALVALAQAIVDKFWPEYSDPQIWAAVYPLAALASGWFVKDAPNQEAPNV
jgi:hypothetical protein